MARKVDFQSINPSSNLGETIESEYTIRINLMDSNINWRGYKPLPKYQPEYDEIKFGNNSKILMSSAPPTLEDAHKLAKKLVENKVSYVLVLLSNEELLSKYKLHQSLFDAYREYGLKVLHYPIQDFSIPRDLQSFDEVVKKVLGILRSGESILVHCQGGHGRTGLIVVGAIIRLGNDPYDAYQYVNTIRDVVETKQQYLFLQKYYRSLHISRNVHNNKNERRK